MNWLYTQLSWCHWLWTSRDTNVTQTKRVSKEIDRRTTIHIMNVPNIGNVKGKTVTIWYAVRMMYYQRWWWRIMKYNCPFWFNNTNKKAIETSHTETWWRSNTGAMGEELNCVQMTRWSMHTLVCEGSKQQ